MGKGGWGRGGEGVRVWHSVTPAQLYSQEEKPRWALCYWLATISPSFGIACNDAEADARRRSSATSISLYCRFPAGHTRARRTRQLTSRRQLSQDEAAMCTEGEEGGAEGLQKS